MVSQRYWAKFLRCSPRDACTLAWSGCTVHLQFLWGSFASLEATAPISHPIITGFKKKNAHHYYIIIPFAIWQINACAAFVLTIMPSTHTQEKLEKSSDFKHGRCYHEQVSIRPWILDKNHPNNAVPLMTYQGWMTPLTPTRRFTNQMWWAVSPIGLAWICNAFLLLKELKN